ncbi:Uncharacterised protein [uncultured Ruminococcus sp.]|uniref:Molecular chaperone GroEL n=1 Tax=Massiliimalia timonensis TaxID=1987501 RepID=A0A8J6P1B2_9FIRM|nr:hypothetical protein [Massiliimalia timonensis]MBC8611061.1 hypothetical protein [Massiliimalia timonensis]SCI17970.1 Uncharacterised protein [uncultured Clostridium sp.]SCI42190.1 Uncharacterised protein [uncultured Ruminococcus sp.]
MSTIGPKIKSQFESLSEELKQEILSRDVTLNSLTDLIKVLEKIVDEGENQ